MKRLLGIVLGVAAVGLAVIAPASSQTKATKLVTQIYIGNYGAKWAYDFADVDSAKGLYFLTDRDSKGIDVIDIKHSKLAYKVTGFTGNKGKPEISGPNGVVVIPGTDTAYVSDVNSVKVVDLAAQKITKSIPTNTSGNRTDGGCLDPADKLTLWSLGDDDPPSIAFISTASASVVGRLTLPGAAGVEGCQYEPITKRFYVSIPGDKANPGGAIDVFNPTDILAGKFAPEREVALTDCAPTGNAVGPTLNGAPQLAISCDPTDGGKDGDPIFSLVMNLHDFTVTKIPQVGGSDEVAYSSKTNKYYFAARNWFPSGKNNVGPKEAVLGVVDAGTNSTPPAWVENVPTCSPGKNGGCTSGAHSVAADPVSGRIFVPIGGVSAARIAVYSE
ncbi:MAG: hypothetical protein ABI186_04020 [Candidatus Elarobacter sp.]